MTVRELIDFLATCDPELRVVLDADTIYTNILDMRREDDGEGGIVVVLEGH